MSLNNLGNHLSDRYHQLGAVEALSEAIVLARDTLELCPLGHPGRSRSLDNLAGYLLTRFRGSSQLKDKEELFNLYAQLAHLGLMVSSTELSVTRTWISVAEDFRHPTLLLAYQTSLRLLTHLVAALPPLPQHRAVLKELTSSLAVVLMEHGRGAFWSQVTRLRSPLDDVVASGPTGRMLTNKFKQQTLLIRTALDLPSPGQHDQVCRLNVGSQSVVTRICEFTGLFRFLLPPAFTDFRQAARDDPVTIVNASKYGCDVLVVLVDGRNPVHIPLSTTKEGVRELSSRLGALTVRAKSMDVRRDLGVILRELWDEAVSPIVDFL